MAHRIEVFTKPEHTDALGEKTNRRIRRDLGIELESVRAGWIYTIDKDLSPEQLKDLASGPFSDPIIQEYSIDRPLAQDFNWVIEVGYRPGVTDNVGRTSKEAAQQRLGISFEPGETVYTSIQYLFKGALDRDQAETIAKKILGNELIQRFEIRPADSWDSEVGVGIIVPKVISQKEPEVRTINLQVADDELVRISKEGTLALTLEEMKTIRDYFADESRAARRKELGLSGDPTDVELETMAQTWSEHCKHKIFNATIQYSENDSTEEITSLFDTYIKASTKSVRQAKGDNDFCLSVFKDNAGVIRFTPDWNLVMKAETHNSPSALDPYGGALTGIVGVNRDPFGTGMGAKLIFNTDVFCFASPFWDEEIPPKLLHPRRVFEGVREGVEHGGNKSGIPTVNGTLIFDRRYAGKPLVYCGTGGIMPAVVNGQPSEDKTALPGDKIIMTGGRIGKDGIHGATFSSEQLHEGSPATAVQIGDPITQKRMTDFLLVARDAGLYRCITDNGAGGLSSSVGEMALFSGGSKLDLTDAPLKYAGLDPWEILLSEAQERMTLAVPPKNVDAFLKLAERYNVEATVMGEFTDTGLFQVFYQGKAVADIDLDFMHDGTPDMLLEAHWERPEYPEPELALGTDLTEELEALLGRLNICSKEAVVRQYDHEVQAGSVLKPLVGACNDGPGDAAVVRPLLDLDAGVVVANGICPKYSDLDTYHMMANAIDEAVRNAVAVGGDVDYMAGLDNFCWCDPVVSEGNPDGRYKLAQLVRANRALYDVCTAYGVPCISGKDSMKNDFHWGDVRISIPPTVLYSVISVIPDVNKVVSMDVKRPGDLVYVLGTTADELGGSEFYAQHGAIGNSVPVVDVQANLKLYRRLHQAITGGLVASAHDLSDGGLGVALAESAFAGDFGIEANLICVPATGDLDDSTLLFSESAGRFVVTIHPDQAEKFEMLLASCPHARIGEVTKTKELKLMGLNGEPVIVADLDRLKAAWKKTLDF